jgi:hypothetical protein
MLPPLTDPANPPLIEVRGAEQALEMAARGYRVLWQEATPEGVQAARRLLMAQPFLVQNRIEGIVLERQ